MFLEDERIPGKVVKLSSPTGKDAKSSVGGGFSAFKNPGAK